METIQNPYNGIAVTAPASGIGSYLFVKPDASESTANNIREALAVDATVPVMGITQDTTTAIGQIQSVAIPGQYGKLVVDGSGTAIVPGTLLIPNSSGRGVPAGAASATAQWVGAIALENSAAAGDVIPVLLVIFPFGKFTA